MSEVNASDTRPITSIEDVYDTYLGAGDDAKTGVEVELAFFDPESPDLDTMSVCQNKVVKNAANSACGNTFIRNEPTSEMLEVGSIATKPESLGKVLKDTQKRIECLTEKAADIGLKRSYFQHLPDKTAKQLLANLMDVDRYQAFFGPPRDDMQGVAAYFSVCKSNQVSVSYKNADHMLENVRRLYVLAPFLFTVLDNSAPFNEGQAFTGNPGMHHRASLGGRGGVPPYVFSAKSGEEYIKDHVDHVMNNPLFVYYTQQGELIRIPSGEWLTFNDLREKGLNTATNYFFSESILWPDVKIAALKDAKGEVINHRYEARMLGVGMHQHQTAAILIAALAFDPTFAHSVDQLLNEYGFDQTQPQSLKSPLNSAYKSAREHDLNFMNISYGNGSMSEFALAFADLIEKSYFITSYDTEIAPLLGICRTGLTDSKVNAYLFNTLDKAKKFQREYDPALFENPLLSAQMVFEKELAKNPDWAGSTTNCS